MLEHRDMSDEERVKRTRPKKPRLSRADAKVMTRSCRRTLKQKPNPDSDETWADILNFKLYEIASHEDASLSLSLQAVKTVIELCGAHPIDTKIKREEAELKNGKDSLHPLPEEEALSDEELDAQIAELQGRLGSIPEAGS
jgi:hypothetical protein